MPIDKFGRLSANGTNDKGVARGPPGEGFKLTPDGNYDIQNKTLTNVREPNAESDAVNFKTINELCVLHDENTIDAKGRKIINVRDPVRVRDVVNKRYFDNNVPTKAGSYWGFSKKRLVSVADPIDDGDVVTKKYLLSYCPNKTANDGWEFQNKRIKLVAAAKEDSDAVNLNTLNSQTNLVESRLSDRLTKEINQTNSKLNEIESIVLDNKRSAETQLRTFGSLLFRHIHRSQSRSSTQPPETEDNYLNWEEIFRPSVIVHNIRTSEASAEI